MTTHAHHPGAPDHISAHLPAYLNGTLALAGPDAPTSSSIAAHLRECPACRQELAAWTAIAHAVPAVSAISTPVNPAPGALDALMAAIDTQPLPKRSTPARTPQERPMPDSIAMRPPLLADRRSRTRIASLGLIAAVLILIATVAITFAPDPDPERPRLPAIAAASPATTSMSDTGAPSASVQIVPPTEAIDIAECTTEPRPPGTVAGLLAAQERTLYLDGHRDDEAGTEPSAETLAGIDATLRQIVACRYAYFEGITSPDGGSLDLDGRTLALYSDGWVTGLAAEMAGEDGDGIDVIRTPFLPIDSAVLIPLSAVQLRDGSVRVSLPPPSEYYDSPRHQPESLEMRFVLEDGRWLVDDWWEEPLGGDGVDYTTPPPSIAPAPQAVQVIVADAVVYVYPTSAEVRLSAGQETTVSVANLRDVPLAFAFPSLGFSISIDPGHSVDLSLTDLVGIHPIEAIPAGGSDLIDSSLILWPDQSSPTPESQADATDTANDSPYVHIRSQDEAIDIADCTTEPRPPGTVAQLREALRGTPEIGLPRSSQAYDWAPSLGWPEPDTETRSGIEETLRQIVACRFSFLPPGAETYDLDNRFLALFSERYVVGLAIEMEGDGFRLPFIPYDSAPLTIVDIAEHEDGRVLVSLGELPGSSGTVYVLFEMQNGTWVVDDWGDIRYDQTYPEPRMPARYTVIATDDMGRAWQTPFDEPLRSDSDVILTVANLRDSPVRFEIPSLGFATDIAAGHSVDLIVHAPPGTYGLDVIPDGEQDLIADSLTLHPYPDAAATPKPQPDLTRPTDTSPYIRIRSQDEVIDSAECMTAPRDPGTVAQLRAAHGGTPEPGIPTPNPLLNLGDFFDPTLDGAAAAPETIAAIESTLRQLVACRSGGMATLGTAEYDLDSRHLALFSDRYVVGLAMEMESDIFRLPFAPYDSAPLPIIAAVDRPEGVLVRLGAVPGYGEQTVHLVMVQEHGKWVIDDWQNFIVCANPASPPQRAPRATGVEMPQVLPIVATDDFATIWRTPELDPLQAGTDVIITVANLGEASIRFEIAGLGFATDVAAGHSLDLVVNAPAGTYPLALARPGTPDMLDADLTLEPEPSGTPTPTCSP